MYATLDITSSYFIGFLRCKIQFCRVINSEEVVCEGEDSKELLHSEDCKASSEKTDVNGICILY